MSVVHGCPPDGSSNTPCCNRLAFELPITDRMTSDPTLVTCKHAVVATASFPGNEKTPPIDVEYFRTAPGGQAFCIWQDPDATTGLRDSQLVERDLVALTHAQAAALAEWLLKRLAEGRPAGAKQ